MQTFLPYADFERSARVLDAKRLGKQRVECIQVVVADAPRLRLAATFSTVLIWKGHEEALGRCVSSLLRKDPEHYRPLFPEEPDDLDYVWPVRRMA